MRQRLWSSLLTVAILLSLLLATPLLSACGGEKPATTPPVEEPVTPAETAVVEIDVVRDAVAAYLANRPADISAADLHMMIAEGDAPLIVSLRSAADYAKGHIPGAINIPFSELATLPMDGEVVVYCYTGQSGSFATAVLGVLGYDVHNLHHGMAAWSTDPEVYVTRFNPATDQGDYAVETTANEPGTFSLPVLDNTDSDNETEIIAAAAATVSPKYITAANLNMMIAEDADMTIVSVRSAADYTNGHIPGAIDIPLSDLAASLEQINPDAPVYVYCYTGHTGSQATALLQMLGYDAYNLKYGMCSWTPDTAVNMGYCFNPDTVQGYDVEQ